MLYKKTMIGGGLRYVSLKSDVVGILRIKTFESIDSKGIRIHNII
jgi:hypothetical protein